MAFDSSGFTKIAFSDLIIIIFILQIRKTGTENVSILTKDKQLIGNGTGIQI